MTDYTCWLSAFHTGKHAQPSMVGLLPLREISCGSMFLEIDGYFISQAKINKISASTEAWEAEVGDLSIDMVIDAGETIWLLKGFDGLAHAEEFRCAVIRRARTGLCTGEDLDQIFPSTKPDPPR